MTRVLLITPYGFQNMGVRILAAVLEKAGISAQILYFKGWRNNDIEPPTDVERRLLREFVARYDPHVLGIGFGTPYLSLVTDLTRELRAVTRAHIVWGGVHPTIAPEDCIEHADSVCIGEGEGPLVDLARAVEDGPKKIETIPNLWVRQGEQITRNPPRPLIKDLDGLPFAAQCRLPTAVIEDNRLTDGDPQEDNALYRIMASRGCPFSCAFCYNSQYRRIYAGLGRYHRTRSVASVMDELTQAKAARPALRRIRFDDDTFVFPRPWLDAFAREYPRRIGLPFDILLNPQASGERTLRLLRDAGLVHVQVGIQTGSEEALARQFSRRGSRRRLLELAHQLHDLGVAVTYDVILDNPLATRQEKQDLLDLLLELPRPFNLFLYSLVVFPRSQIAETLRSQGLITDDDIEGRATKSFRQFRLTLDYPRPAEDTFYASLVSMTSKGFLPRRLIRALAGSETLLRNPAPVRLLAEAANVVKLGEVGLGMLRRGELSRFKLREYASYRRRLIQ